MRNNSKDADGKGFPLKITAVKVEVVDNPDAGAVGQQQVEFVQHLLPNLEWGALVQVGQILVLDFYKRYFPCIYRCTNELSRLLRKWE